MSPKLAVFKLAYWFSVISAILGIGDDIISVSGLSPDQLKAYESYQEEQLNARVTEAELAYEEWKADHTTKQSASPWFPADSIGNILNRPKLPRKTYIKDFLYAGSITSLNAEPKGGKTTLNLHALGQLTTGGTFLGEQLVPTVVLYASEQGEASFVAQAEKVPSLIDNQRFIALTIDDNFILDSKTGKHIRPGNWKEQIDFWANIIRKSKAGVFVPDTFGAFAQFKKAGEAIDSGVMQDKMSELRMLQTEFPSLATYVPHHLRKEFNGPKTIKKDRSFSDMANSYALRAGTDQNILMFCPSTNDEDKNVRTIEIEGRFIDGKTSFQVIKTPDGFVRRELYNKDEAEGKIDHQAMLLELAYKDPNMQNLSSRDVEKTYGINHNHVDRFRKTYPKGTQPARLKVEN